MTPRTRALASLLAVVLTTALTACGGSKTKTVTVGSTTPTTTSTSNPATSETVTTPPPTPTAPTTTTSTPTTSDASSSDSGDPITVRGKIGATLSIKGSPYGGKVGQTTPKPRMQITLHHVIGPFSGFQVSAKDKIIGLTLTIKGLANHYSDPQPSGTLILNTGETGKPQSLITGSGTNPCPNPSIKLKKGKTQDFCVAFEIPKNAKPLSFEYDSDSGFGDKAVWKLR